MEGLLTRGALAAAGLLTAGLLIVACSGGSGGSDAYGENDAVQITGTSTTVKLENNEFHPQGIKVKPGTTVTWVNNEAAIHNVRQVESVFLSQDVMEKGDTFSFTFDEPGKYRYVCTYHHPNMNGVVIVEE